MKIDHIGIAVRSLDEALAFFSDALGLQCTGRETVAEQGVRVAFLPVGESRLELLEPIHEDSPVGRFLRKRGEGIHHICLMVDDIDVALADLRARNVRLVDETPRCGAEGRKIAFLHPSSSHGVLIELVENPDRSNGCREVGSDGSV
ncbi:MAG TPA: methylmalonyl-CoA epimerase [Blastocatellia bacterium]|nr:methylmalonyl-CoA epimerase [Blastocatellia bacterium]